MKSSILLIAGLVGAAAGAGSALITATAFADDATEVRPAATPGGLSADEIADLRAQSAQLSERLRMLEAQLALASDNRVEVNQPQPAAADNQFDADALNALLASLNQPDQPPPAGLQRLVERALEDKESRELLAKEEADRIRREERLDERMAEMAEKLGLDSRQREDVRTALSQRDEARTAFFREMRDGAGGWGGGDRDAMRESMTAISTKATTALQGSMSPAQYEQYKEEYPDRFGGGGRDRGRGGRGE